MGTATNGSDGTFLLGWRLVECMPSNDPMGRVEASVKIVVAGRKIHEAGAGDTAHEAIFTALSKAFGTVHPYAQLHLVNHHTRTVLDPTGRSARTVVSVMLREGEVVWWASAEAGDGTSATVSALMAGILTRDPVMGRRSSLLPLEGAAPLDLPSPR